CGGSGCGSRHCPWHTRVPAHSAGARTAQALEIRGAPLPGSGGDRGWLQDQRVPVWGLVRGKSTKDGEHKKWFEAKLRREIGLLGPCPAMGTPRWCSSSPYS